MNDTPYTFPEEDPFNVHASSLQQPRRRRSSLLDKWIQEQQQKGSKDERPPTSLISRYLAYPELGKHYDPSREDVVTLDNYDLVNDDDIPQAVPDDNPVITTPTKRTSKILQTPTSFRGFKSFRSMSPTAQSLPDASSPLSRFSLLQRTPRHSPDASNSKNPGHRHNRSTSFSTANLAGKNAQIGDIFNFSGSTNKWRPSVLGHFAASSTSVPSDTADTPSRPSMSSGDTVGSGTVTTESDFPMTPSRMNLLDSIRFRSSKPNKTFFASTSGTHSSNFIQAEKSSSTPVLSIVDSGPGTASTSTLAHRTHTKISSNIEHAHHDDDDDDDNDDNNKGAATAQHKKQPDPTRPHVAYSSGGTLPRVSLASLSTRQRKKKRLVISGVGPKDVKKFEGVKQWCESFGEVNQIVRMPNGDLHVHFRLAEVADTVCRVRAKVFIAKVGSVQLSWISGEKR